ELAAKISYDAERDLLSFAGIMTSTEQAALKALVPHVLPADIAYHDAVDNLFAQPDAIARPDERIWLTDNDMDATLPANNSLAKPMAAAAQRGMAYLQKTLSENAIVQQSSAQLGLTEALTRFLFEEFRVMPPIAPDPLKATVLKYFTQVFGPTSGV